jgi:hypothetical protein
MVYWPARDVPALTTVDVHRGHRSGRVPWPIWCHPQSHRLLERKVIAEGVETAEQAKTLRDLTCAFAQGYLYSRPVPASAIDQMLQASPRLPVKQWTRRGRRSDGREGPMRQAGADLGGQASRSCGPYEICGDRWCALPLSLS